MTEPRFVSLKTSRIENEYSFLDEDKKSIARERKNETKGGIKRQMKKP